MEESTTENPITPTPITTTQHVVVFGKHEYIVENAETLLTKGGYATTGFVDVELAMEYIKANSVAAILVGGGVDPHDRMKLKELVDSEFKHIKMVDHFGGPATILSEIKTAIG
jgi:copper homeostasis protein CutC